LDTNDVNHLRQRSDWAQSLILEAPLPAQLESEIRNAYRQLCDQYGQDTDVAVRSSATAEDLPDASFAGQQENYLNMYGEQALLDSCKKCFASFLTARVIA
jgi:pyruvate,water dikinase